MAAPMPRVPPVTTATRPMFPHPPPLHFLMFRSSRPLDAHGDAHAAAYAQCRKALARLALAHLVEQRDEHAGARSTDRVADGDGAPIHVYDLARPSHVLVD